jgi:hypothetical protein
VAESARTDPLIWKVPPWQVAVLFLLVAACAATDIYLRPAGSTALVTGLIGVVGFGLAVAGMRMYLVVDGEGAAVRFVGAEKWLPWPEVARVEVVSGVRGADTIRFVRTDGSYVNVPPALLQPSAPTSRPSARHRLREVARQIEAYRPELPA